ncbi:Ubiquinone biosynthesis protein coq9, mitochondrial [Ascosphaera acerosa]|nr:Ubiquinone biosynthesis protein coq9, mitochondrial [Ascosphaera acerosa]
MFYLASKRGELQELVNRGQLESWSSMTEDKKVRALVWERLQLNKDALALMSLPSNIPSALHELYALASDILHLAGDASIDTRWYTRRLQIASVYAATDFAMTGDDSPDLAYTREFLGRRWEDAESVFGGVADVKQFLEFKAHTLFGILRSFGAKI